MLCGLNIRVVNIIMACFDFIAHYCYLIMLVQETLNKTVFNSLVSSLTKPKA